MRVRIGARSAAGALALALLACGAVAAPAGADTPQQVREQLAARRLQPPPLYPSRLPAPIRDADARLDVVGSRFTVTWMRPLRPDGYPSGYLTFSRGRRGQLAADLYSVRRRGFQPYTVQLGRRRVWRLCGHICGYEWREDGYSYGAFGTYYLAHRTTDQANLRAIIRTLAPLLPTR